MIGDWLPSTQAEQLNQVVEHWREPLDPKLARLTKKGGARRDWLDAVRNGTQSVRDGLTACHYHLSRIEQIENEIISFCDARGDVFREGHDVSFRAPALSAEYAALQFALRRTLDYMTSAVAGFFRTSGGSFRRLSGCVRGKAPVALSDAIIHRLDRAGLSSILGTAEGHSVRDQLAHHQVVELAWFGVQRIQGKLKIRYSSEVEEISTIHDPGDAFLTTPYRGRDLSQAAAGKVALVEEVIFGLFADMQLIP